MLAKGYLAGNSMYTCICHTPDVIDAATLKAVGQTLANLIYNY